MKENKDKDGQIFMDTFEDKPKNPKATLKRLLGLLMQQKWTLTAIVFANLAGIGLLAVTPLILGGATDALIQGINEQGFGGGFVTLADILKGHLLLFLGVYLLISLFSYLQEYIMAGVGERLVLSLRKKVSEKITKLPLRFFDSRQTGDVLSRTTNDLDVVSDTLQTGLLEFIGAVFNITISIIIMLSLNPLLTALILAAMSVSVFAAKWISKKNFEAAAENQAVLGELNGKIEEFFTGNLIIKSFNQQQAVTNTVREISERQYKANKKAQFVMSAIYPAISFLTQLGFVVAAIAGGIFAANGKMTIGTVQAFLQYVSQISEPITQASFFMNSLQAALAAAERVFEFLDEEEEAPDTASPKHIKDPKALSALSMCVLAMTLIRSLCRMSA